MSGEAGEAARPRPKLRGPEDRRRKLTAGGRRLQKSYRVRMSPRKPQVGGEARCSSPALTPAKGGAPTPRFGVALFANPGQACGRRRDNCTLVVGIGEPPNCGAHQIRRWKGGGEGSHKALNPLVPTAKDAR